VVRIMFRGLILFEFPTDGPNAGKFVAYLINNAKLTGGLAKALAAPKAHGPHEHHHSGEIQVIDDGQGGHDPKPVMLDPGENVNIVVAGQKLVSAAASFNRHVPDLEAVVARGTGAIRNLKRGKPKHELIQNIVTVDRGVAHVKNVTDWDEEGYPLSGNPADRGQRPGSPVLVKFMGSDVRGHVASEVVVEIEDATEVELEIKKGHPLHGRRRGSNRPNHRVPTGTVEVVVTNYEFRREEPVAWGLDYQWLFETVGYPTTDLAGPEFERWREFATRYDAASFRSETDVLLEGPRRTEGAPRGGHSRTSSRSNRSLRCNRCTTSTTLRFA
jgi:hypothetical protein